MTTVSLFNAAVERKLANRIAARLGDSIGNREALILSDPDVTVRVAADYPGCRVVRSPLHGTFVWRYADNHIVN